MMLKAFLCLATISTSIDLAGHIYIDFFPSTRLANKMFLYATAYAVATSKGLAVAAEADEIERIFQVSYVHTHKTNSPRYKVLDSNYNGRPDNQEFKPSILNAKDGSTLTGFFQTDKYFYKYRSDLIKQFQLRDRTITDQAQQILNQTGKFTICAHMRLGDYVKLRLAIMDNRYYFEAISLILKELNLTQRECAVIIISDEPYHNKVVSLTNFLTDQFPELQISVQNQSSILLDFELMRLADACITSASTFSWWGAWLNEICRLIVSPKYWLNYYNRLGRTYPADIEMSLPHQRFIFSTK